MPCSPRSGGCVARWRRSPRPGSGSSGARWVRRGPATRRRSTTQAPGSSSAGRSPPFRGSAPLTQEWRNFRFALEDGVATVTFNRPDRLNALTFEVYADLRDLLGELPHRDDVRVLVITGEGRGFCSGGDVHEIIGRLLETDPQGLLDFTRMTGSVVQRMRECPRPIIAAVNGVAAGAGAVIALAADLRLLARSSSFAFLFTKVGLAGA